MTGWHVYRLTGKQYTTSIATNTDEWQAVSRRCTFSPRSLMPDSRWYEQLRSESRNDAYHLMKAQASIRSYDYVVMVPWTLVGNDGREKAVVCFPGSETSLLRDRQERIHPGLESAVR